MKQNYCSSCGKKITEEAKFCSHCGEPISAVLSSEKNEVKKETAAAKSNSLLVMVLSGVFALIVIYLVLDSNTMSVDQQKASGSNEMAQQQQQMSQMMENIKNIKAQLDADPTNYSLLVQMGNGNFDVGRYKEAISYYKRATFINPNDPPVLIDMGVAYFNLSKSDSALIYMNHALTIEPQHAQGLYNTGIVYFNLGDSVKAISQWEKLVESNSGSPQAEAAKKYIEKLKSELTKS